MNAAQQPSAAVRLGQDAAQLAAEQARELVGALAEPLRRSGRGSLLFGAAAVSGGFAVATAHLAVLRAAERVLPRPAAALMVAAAYAAGCAGCAMAGRAAFRQAAEESDAAVRETSAPEA